MTAKKPDHMPEQHWKQHLKWLDLVSNECKSNELKRRREKRGEKAAGRSPGDIVRPSA